MPRVLNGKKGHDAIPADAIYIGRRMPWHPDARVRAGSKWANPFKIPRDGDRPTVIAKHRAWLCDQPALMAALPELRGRDLFCWCAPEACHGDALLELANVSASLRP